MHTKDDVSDMYERVFQHAETLLVRLENMERIYRMGMCTERELSQASEHLATQRGALHALAWVLGHTKSVPHA